jgi:hypothetical protein
MVAAKRKLVLAQAVKYKNSTPITFPKKSGKFCGGAISHLFLKIFFYFSQKQDFENSIF